MTLPNSATTPQLLIDARRCFCCDLSQALESAEYSRLLRHLAEFAPRRIRATMITMGVFGVTLGGGFGALVASQLLGTYGWQIVFWIGGAIPIILATAGFFVFPESIRYLTLAGNRRAELVSLLRQLDKAIVIAENARFALNDERNAPAFSFGALLAGRLKLVTPLLWVSNFLTLMLLYFASQWTPILLASSGISAQRAALAIAAFQISGFLGAFAVMRPVDRTGYLPVPILFAVSAPVIAMMGIPGLSETAVIALAGVAGFCTIGVQFSNIATQSQVYPTFIRAWGVGACFGAGRIGGLVGSILAGVLIGAYVSINTLFYLAGATLLIGVVVGVILVPLYQRQLHDMRAQSAGYDPGTEGREVSAVEIARSA